MYDNKNNNQNFNNGNDNGMVRPLFENDFKTIPGNNGIQQPEFSGNLGYQPQMNQSSFGYQNQPVNSFNNSFTSQTTPTPDFMNNSYGNPLSMNQPSSVDIPPELGEIKNLNEATIASAPTMDVLNPMNIMNTTPNQPQDRLDAYESGSLNIPNQGYFYEQQFVNQPQNYQPNQQFINQPQNYNVLGSAPYEMPISNIPSNQFNNANQPNTSFSGNPYNTFEMPYQPNPQSSETPTFNSVDNLKQTPIQGEVSAFPLENRLEQNQNEPKESTDTDVNDNDNDNISSDKETQEAADIDYNIVQDDKLSEDKNESKNLSDLGIENAYDEPDMLDIMDITDDESSDDSKAKSISYNETLDNIKKIIEDLKSKGAKIDLEEFDFEQMYQLIIKINK